ncbi:MAG: ribosome small subunit-dependent GTPase A [Oscillospiraceae bacterium]|nr:ribosome small subunit-dependent GTPase A [Oscillospiraceae bacterium]
MGRKFCKTFSKVFGLRRNAPLARAHRAQKGGISITGIITKGIGGFYYVAVDSGKVFECRARGIFRHESEQSGAKSAKSKLTPCVGDKVDISILDDEKNIGVVDNIHPRENMLVRPPVANVSQIAIVIATKNPAPNFLLVDKLIIAAEREGIDVLICVNKTDIKTANEVSEIYETAGFPVIPVCAATEQNFDKLSDMLQGKITVLAGNSGVGKSSILNILMGEEVMEVGEVSDKIHRGKHTTRHSELLQLKNGGFIIDTPGFSAFEAAEIRADEIEVLFREFEPCLGKCKFTGCSHVADKGCAVIEAIEAGQIPQSRHQSYINIFESAKAVKDWQRK